MGPDGGRITGSDILINGGVTASWYDGPWLRIAPEKQSLIWCGCRARMMEGHQAGDTMLRRAHPGVAPSPGLPR